MLKVSKLAVRLVTRVIHKHFAMALRGLTATGVYDPCNSQCNSVLCWKWDISPVIYRTKPVNYAVLVLNTPITQSQRFFTELWNNAKVRITVDGGTKKWETFINGCPENMQTEIKLPDLVTGDFDSISQVDLEKYRKKGETHARPVLHGLHENLDGTIQALPGNQHRCGPRHSNSTIVA